MEKLLRPGRAALLIAAASALPQIISAKTPATRPAVTPAFDISALEHVQISIPTGSPLTAYPLNSPPINGFQPQVVMTLTDEQGNSSDIESFPDTPGPNALPLSGGPKYVMATFDTGSQSHIVTNVDGLTTFDLPDANRESDGTATVIGAAGTEVCDVTQPLGVYATGIASVIGTGAGTVAIAGNDSSVVGQYNNAILQAHSDSALPNLVGSPMLAHYAAEILNSDTRHITVGSTVVQTPQINLRPLDETIHDDWGRLSVTLPTPLGDAYGSNPFYLPAGLLTDQGTPTFWGTPEAAATPSNGTLSAGEQQMIFDTGASVSVISTTIASKLGIFTRGANKTPVDFTVTVTGVGGTKTQVPGYFISSLSILTDAENMDFTHVPVLVLNLPDPSGAGNVPGILGMNLFTDRDLYLNLNGPDGPYIAFSPQMTPQWNVNSGGNWGDDSKWLVGVPLASDAPANFLSAITSPTTITVDANYTLGSMKFDNANRYTIDGPGRLTLQTFIGSATIEVDSGSHTINAPMTLANAAVVNVVPAASTLTITSDVDGGSFGLTKQGGGVLEMKNVRAGALTVGGGAFKVLPNGSMSGAGRITSLSISNGATLDLTNNALAIDYDGTSPASSLRGFLQSGYASGSWTGAGLLSSTAALVAEDASNHHKTGIGYAEASTIGTPSQWFGQNIDDTSLVTRYVFAGDANLDGTVDANDFVKLSQDFGGTNNFWWQGDFNYDGVVNALDFNMLASNFGQVMSEQALGAMVPEPAAGILMGLVFLSRRRSKRV